VDQQRKLRDVEGMARLRVQADLDGEIAGKPLTSSWHAQADVTSSKPPRSMSRGIFAFHGVWIP
jgi:hypothetical protein